MKPGKLYFYTPKQCIVRLEVIKQNQLANNTLSNYVELVNVATDEVYCYTIFADGRTQKEGISTGENDSRDFDFSPSKNVKSLLKPLKVSGFSKLKLQLNYHFKSMGTALPPMQNWVLSQICAQPEKYQFGTSKVPTLLQSQTNGHKGYSRLAKLNRQRAARDCYDVVANYPFETRKLSLQPLIFEGNYTRKFERKFGISRKKTSILIPALKEKRGRDFETLLLLIIIIWTILDVYYL